MDFILNKNKYEGVPPPHFANIKVKGYFSLDSERTIKFDCSQLRYYKQQENKKVNLDLNDGIETTQWFKDADDHHLHYILRWIIEIHKENVRDLQGESQTEQPNFVCRRGTIDRILNIPFKTNEHMIICAAKWKGIIYLCTFDKEAQITDSNNELPPPSRGSYWAYKFQQYLSSDSININESPDTTERLDQNSQFCCIFQSRLAGHVLLYSAKMDAVISDEILEEPIPLNNIKFIGLKTHPLIETEWQQQKFDQFTTLKWWSLLVTTGVENILYGIKDSKGIVKELKTIRVDDLTKTLNDYWNPSTSLNFCNDFLSHLAEIVKDECDETIYKLEKFPNDNVIHMNKVSPSSEYSFLPDWYTKNTA